MSLTKLFNRIFWYNNTTPALNEDNLNAMSKALDDIDDRVIELGDDILEKVPQIEDYLDRAEDLVDQMEELSKNPPYIGANGNWYVWNTETEQYEDSHVDASITVAIADITMIATTAAPYVTNTGTNTDPVFHLYIPKGKELVSITKTATSGLEDTYTISYSDGTSTTFMVVNGNGISTIAKTSTLGLVDTYTITMDNGATATFNVTNGRGIVSIIKTETVGYTDTYTITYNDGTTSEFYVHNGKSGSGSNITVSTNDPELFGRPVTITDQYQRTESQDFNSSGLTRFDSLEMDGQITISSTTAGGYTATNTLTLTYFGNYSAQLSLWRAVVDITAPAELYGASVVVRDSNNVIVDTVTLSAVDGSGIFQTFESDTYTFEYTYHGYTYTEQIALTSSGTYSLAITKKATVSITGDADIYGYTVVVKNTNNQTVDSVVLDPLDGTATVILFETGSFTFNFVYDGDAYDESLTVVSGTTSYSLELSIAKLVSWNSGSDADIAKMINAYYAGKFTLAQIQSVWSIGDVRNVNISAIASSGTYNDITWTVGESHRAQTVQVEILDFNHDELTTPVGSITNALISVDLKNCLRDANVSDTNGANNTERGYMYPNDQNNLRWNQTSRYKWCESAFLQALPEYIRTLIKPVEKACRQQRSATATEKISSKVFLPSLTEITGYGSEQPYREGTQYKLFETTSNRYKLPKDTSSSSSGTYWARMVGAYNTSNFYTGPNGSSYKANTTYGLAPAFCL